MVIAVACGAPLAGFCQMQSARAEARVTLVPPTELSAAAAAQLVSGGSPGVFSLNIPGHGGVPVQVGVAATGAPPGSVLLTLSTTRDQSGAGLVAQPEGQMAGGGNLSGQAVQIVGDGVARGTGTFIAIIVFN